jgi:hypothetical protein
VTLGEQWNGAVWTIEPAPTPSGATGSDLAGVSCAIATACTAVGYYVNSSGTQVPLAERWNGTAWTIQTTPTPSGATSSSLSGVSCTSASACTAVGASDFMTLAEQWNGTDWTIPTTPSPPSDYGYGGDDYKEGFASLNGVSCTATTACTAVGFVSYTYCVTYPHFPPFCKTRVLTLAEESNGTAWTIQTTPGGVSGVSSFRSRAGRSSPAINVIASRNVLTGVSCVSVSACSAVGQSNGTTLAEVWNGSDWAIQTTPNPTGGSGVSGVSCTAPAACTAVGQGNGVTLAERWSGTSWAIQTTSTPAGPASRSLSGVSCATATNCTAVGAYTNASGTQLTLAEGWGGTTWAIEPTPTPSGATISVLSGVSCATASACTAVGYYVNSSGTQLTLAEQWNGTAWTIQTNSTPSGATSSSLAGVSCTSPSACTAVGYYVNSSGTQLTLAEQWDGTTWTIQTTPTPSGVTSSSLSGVSCTSASTCTAVGTYSTGPGTQLTLAEHWNGGTWTIQTTPNPSPATSSVLSDVSCTSATGCTAVGSYQYNTSTAPVTSGMLAEQWNGGAWTVEPTPAPPGAAVSVLSGVSCATVSGCTAVGYYNDNPSPEITGVTAFAERLTGTSWSIQLTPNPAASTINSLSHVSCTSATACTAVGDFQNYWPASVTLAERYSG